jgi:hypothetical protein
MSDAMPRPQYISPQGRRVVGVLSTKTQKNQDAIQAKTQKDSAASAQIFYVCMHGPGQLQMRSHRKKKQCQMVLGVRMFHGHR